MKFKDKYGPWALIAGSAEGLGEAWSIALAKRGMNLLMVDNQVGKLATLSEKLIKEYDIQIKTLALDLAEPEAYSKMMDMIKGHECRLLIYNAAYSLIKPFTSHTPDELDSFIEINTRTQIKLVHAFSNHLIGNKQQGGIILMSSLAGLMGMQLVAPYAATKAFAWNLSEAIHHELIPHGIDVMACIAGATSTPAYLKTNPQYGALKPMVMKPEAVAEAALNKLGRKTLFIPGFSNRMNYFILTRLLPRKMASAVANKTIKKMYAHK
jgi:short-subunit dehydrogenase